MLNLGSDEPATDDTAQNAQLLVSRSWPGCVARIEETKAETGAEPEPGPEQGPEPEPESKLEPESEPEPELG